MSSPAVIQSPAPAVSRMSAGGTAGISHHSSHPRRELARNRAPDAPSVSITNCVDAWAFRFQCLPRRLVGREIFTMSLSSAACLAIAVRGTDCGSKNTSRFASRAAAASLTVAGVARSKKKPSNWSMLCATMSAFLFETTACFGNWVPHTGHWWVNR